MRVRPVMLAILFATTAGAALAQTPVERGRYLVNTILTCQNCHTPKGERGVPAFERDLASGLSWDEPPFKVTASNITQDKETGIGSWTEAQIKAAQLYFQIQRYDDSIGYLLKANQLKPDDFETVGNLAIANMEARHFEAAEKWYKAALAKKPDDVTLLDGYCHVLLEDGNAKGAEDAIAQLAKIDPSNQDLTQFRDRLSKLKSGNKTK